MMGLGTGEMGERQDGGTGEVRPGRANEGGFADKCPCVHSRVYLMCP
jgi:hypothetical protein